jgi:hypothetical protein
VDNKILLKAIFDGLSNVPQKPNLEVLYCSKSEGEQRLASVEWENIGVEQTNDFLFKDGKINQNNCGAKWNTGAKLFREELEPQIIQFFSRYSFTDESIDAINFDLSALINYKSLQREFDFESIFYDQMFELYTSGYIPVGYEGDYPNGTFYVMNPQSESSEE